MNFINVHGEKVKKDLDTYFVDPAHKMYQYLLKMAP